ncbi:flagellar motor switch protein FliN [Treponema vincentii ATCC 35580]|jgi:flagellar motor switch protein fliN|uniref:Flagellar motor switch protein FliN n=1 Tax=Treponema vincentii ATCC 35580 TaxID=596324 RepID=C8PRE2_9SPIR|nr:flagellar motor switch protein FliN [Treponema vincentii]EEV20067.1 flagellar motor switch protein FliN [Treponema vincentii ATCC 35580]
MSDGSISQNEIDALLSGMSGGSVGAPAGGAFTPARQEALQKFFDGNVPALAANLDSMTGKTVSVSNPVIELSNREALLQKVPDMAVAVTIDFEGALTGDHLFVLAPEFAEKLVSLVNNEESVKIDDMALSVISETVAQYVGKEISAFDGQGIKGVTNMPAEAHHVPKAMVRLSQDFALLTYSVTIDDGTFNLWEIIAKKTAEQIADKLSKTESAPQAAPVQPIPAQSAPDQGGGMGAMNMPMNGMNGMPQMGQQPMGMGMQMQGGVQAQGGMVMPGMNPNVQSVQFSPLLNGVTEAEQGNIGLIMDVFMEMTVELGRTRKMIKEILSMGEGHIIELDKLAGEPVDILVNHKPIAKGEVVVIDENFGVRVTEILSPAERISDT